MMKLQESTLYRTRGLRSTDGKGRVRANLYFVQYYKEDWEMIDIYTLGSLVIANNLLNGDLMKERSLLAMSTPQGSHVA